MKPHVLFVTEKWRDAHPSSPLSNNFHNLFGSLEATGLATQSRLHFDEYYHANHHRPCDQELLRLAAEERPDLTVFCFIPWFPALPSAGTLATLMNYTKCVFIWPDAVWPNHLQMAENHNAFATLSILWDVDIHWRPNSKFLHLWTPQDPRIYRDPGHERTIDVSFIGNSNYQERRMYLDVLRREGINVHVEGGDSKVVPVDRYADLLQRSKISLNFCMNMNWKEQLKGRIFEVTNCGAMLMESRHQVNWIDRWFTPYVHYVPFENPDALVARVRHYLVNEGERRAIAANGWRRTTEWYSSASWWKYVFSECGVEFDRG